jgi:hypothetical protein
MPTIGRQLGVSRGSAPKKGLPATSPELDGWGSCMGMAATASRGVRSPFALGTWYLVLGTRCGTCPHRKDDKRVERRAGTTSLPLKVLRIRAIRYRTRYLVPSPGPIYISRQCRGVAPAHPNINLPG